MRDRLGEFESLCKAKSQARVYIIIIIIIAFKFPETLFLL